MRFIKDLWVLLQLSNGSYINEYKLILSDHDLISTDDHNYIKELYDRRIQSTKRNSSDESNNKRLRV